MNIEEILKSNRGVCTKLYSFCCVDCGKLVFSFAKYKKDAHSDAKRAGWETYSNIWICPDCYAMEELRVNIEAGGISV